MAEENNAGKTENSEEHIFGKIEDQNLHFKQEDISPELVPFIQLIDKRKSEIQALKKILNDLNTRSKL